MWIDKFLNISKYYWLISSFQHILAIHKNALMHSLIGPRFSDRHSPVITKAFQMVKASSRSL